MNQRRKRWARRILFIGIPGLVLGGLVALAPPVLATVSVGVLPDFPIVAVEGRSHIPGGITVSNTSTGSQSTGNVMVDTITLVPSCGSAGTASCPTPDPGVFRVYGATGVAATACEGTTFTLVTVDATGKLRFDPSTPVVLGPPSALNTLDECRITFEFDVLKLPTIDPFPGSPERQTVQLAGATAHHGDMTTANAAGPDVVTVIAVGGLRVITDPPVPSQILVDGVPSDSYGIWTKLATGPHLVTFRHVEGFVEPAPQTVNVIEGQLTTVTGTFTPRGSLRVQTSPSVAGTISVDGQPRNDFGMWTDLDAGPHEVCFGMTAGFVPPPCQNVNLVGGQLTEITGTYTPNPLASSPTDVGFLRVSTDPPVPSQIIVNGIPRDTWGIWVTVNPGQYSVQFAHVEGFTEPVFQTVTVTAGQTTTVTGTFAPNGSLRVMTDPALPSTITVDGLTRNDWGMWTDLPPGTKRVCFGVVSGYTGPSCVDEPIAAGSLSTVVGEFTPSP